MPLAGAITPAGVLARVDHLVYATPDLALGVQTAEQLFGVRASPGGSHPGEGTRNALLALGPASYFEIIGPDPAQPKPARGRRFGIDEINAPRLTTWVAKGTDLETFAAGALAQGVNLGAVIPGSRKRPDGVVLSWRYTDPRVVLGDRLVPYFIDWGPSTGSGQASHAPVGRSGQGRHAPQPPRRAPRCRSRSAYDSSTRPRPHRHQRRPARLDCHLRQPKRACRTQDRSLNH